MTRAADLPETVPLFPLLGAVLMPRAMIPLHIFEPRYLQLVDDALRSGNRLVGIIQPAGAGMARVGTAGRIVAFQESEDGRMAISLRAVSRFRLLRIESGFQPYHRGRADWSGYAADRRKAAEEDLGFDRAAFMGRLQRFMEARELSTDWNAAAEAEDELLINALCMLLPLEPEDKQALLEAPDLSARRSMLDGLLHFALHAGGASEDVLQ